MKQVRTTLFRLASALALALLVACAQYWIWQQLNRSIEFISASQGIKGFAYNGFQREQSPLKGIYPSTTELAADLELLARSTTALRTYGMTDMPALLKLAGAYALDVTAGAWLERDAEHNELELRALIQAARNMSQVKRLMVGNEVILRADLRPEELIAALDRVRKSVRKPVSTAEPWHVWLRYPELVDHVDFITVHLLPYHEGLAVDQALDYAFQRLDELAQAYPRKKIVIGEIGWPSKGPTLGAAVPSLNNQARFIREFLAHPRTARLDYFLMEAIDQPWKTEVEGWAGPYWGMYNADREQKFMLEGIIERDPHWAKKALNASAIAFLPMLLIAFFLRDWSLGGRLFLSALIQACVSTLIIGLNVPLDYYLTQRDLFGLGILISATLLTAAVLLSHGFEFGEVLFKKKWRRRFHPLPAQAAQLQPFVSVHVACYNEPPEMVIATLNSLARLNYHNFEVLVLDNNTRDEALWRPLEQHCARLGPRFRFFHLDNWPGFKAGALNYGLMVTDPRAEVVGVVDADYVVDAEWLACLLPHFEAGEVAVVQAPQAHRDWQEQAFRRMCNWEFEGFFRIGMHHRNERNALIQHGTMTLVRKQALIEVGGWSEWCICEDTELGLRLIERGYDTRYVDQVLGRGLTPSGFAAIKSQRFRWAFGAMQILKAHLPRILGRSRLNLAQRYHFLTGWFAWLGDALQLVFALGSLLWTLGILLMPQAFGLPVTALALPILGFMAFKAALGPILYRRTMGCPWSDILGASLLSVGLSHTIARGIFAGLVKKKGVFVVTPKAWNNGGALAFFQPVREESGMLLALVLAALALAGEHGLDSLETRLWIGILMLQCLPYLAALLCQASTYLPSRKAASTAGKAEVGLVSES